MSKNHWSPDDLATLIALYPGAKSSVIAEKLGRRVSQIYNKAASLGLKKSAEFFAGPESGRTDGKIGETGRFKKGHVSWNKGKKFDSGGGSHATRFKKGSRPHTWQPIGHEVWRDGYLWRKITDGSVPVRNDYRQVHVLLWEQHNGPIPAGFILVFRNRDSADIVIENLELITRAENMRRNTIHRYPPELRELMKLSGRVKKAIERRHEEQNC